jgi:predicted Zn-dependent peptidase
MEYYTHSLPNGIRLIHQFVNSPVAHCGVIMNTGSRDEGEDQHGMAHFIEHMIFKGTSKRRAHHILTRMEDVGGEINAYTTKEETCLFTSFFNNYYDRAFDLMADLIFNSVFPEKEIRKEKEVIIDEINSYKDSPQEAIYDDFEELAFQPHPIGRNILGSNEALNSYSFQDLKRFAAENYATDQMVVSSVGNLSFSKIVKYFEKHFTGFPRKNSSEKRVEFNRSLTTTHHVEKEMNTYQCHCIMGGLAYSVSDPKRFPLYLLVNMLGGPGMNSRLNMNLRENRGLAYNVESHYNTYSDIGLFQIYFGTDKKDLKRCIQQTSRELRRLEESPLGMLQLSRAKKQLIGQIAISSENNESQMLGNGRSLLLFDKVETLDEITERIRSISATELLEVAHETFNPSKLSYLIFK